MPSHASISPDKLARLVGTARAPTILDVRDDDDFAAAPRLIPGALRRDPDRLDGWAPACAGRSVIVVCARGAKRAQGTAALLRAAGVAAETLEGGFEGWVGEGRPTVATADLPSRDAEGRTRWVTRHRPKVDRIACPWLIRRFVDPTAVFLYVPPSDVAAVAERFAAAAFDIDGAFFSHRGETCTFDTMLDVFGLDSEPLRRLATIVRGADTGRLDLAPEAAGLLAASLGLSRGFADDLEQLDAGMIVYDAFYRWCRDATEETHDWPAHKGRPGPR